MIDANKAEFINYQIFEFIRKNAANIAERTIGERFLELADSHGRSNRYKQSLKITPNQFGFKIVLDYQGDKGEPLGIWFEKSTIAHFVRSRDPEGYLSWIENGHRFFSKENFVEGIKKMNIVHDSIESGIPLFKAKLKKQVEAFMESLNVRSN